MSASIVSGSGYPLVAVIGPTGSGKSELALMLAEELNGEIVNCDSLQIYRRFDIGTAKIGGRERRGIPHHLIDILDPKETFTAGDYARLATGVLEEIRARGSLPVIVGGTGFYLRALLDGLFEGPGRDEALRESLAARERRKPGSLHRLLGRFDPDSARRIHFRDVKKLVRALEVCLLARRPLTALFEEGRKTLEGFRPCRIGLDPPRQALYEKLDARCRRMFEGGLVEEVRGLLADGVPPEAKPFESIGYREVLALVAGEVTEAEALSAAQRSTRRYAKRQGTWFRREQGARWLPGFGDDPQVQQCALAYVRECLADFTTHSFPGSGTK